MRRKTTSDEIRNHLQHLYDGNGKLLTPKIVLHDARRVHSPLHHLFEWDDTRAAELYRSGQARDLIRGVRVEVRVRRETLSVPAWIHTPRTGSGYVSIAKVRSRSAEARLTLMAELATIRGALARARSLASALGFEQEIETLLNEVADLASRAERVAA